MPENTNNITHTTDSSQSEGNSFQRKPVTELYLPKYCILEAPIRENKNIPDAAKIYFGELMVLASKYNSIPYTDEQLAKMKGVDIRTIKRWHSDLQKEGFIKKFTKNHLVEGKKCKWKPERTMYLTQTPGLKKCSDRDKNVPLHEGDKNVPLDDRDKNVPCNKQELKQEKKQQQPAAPAVAFFDCLNEKWISRKFAEEIMSKGYEESYVKQKVEMAKKYSTSNPGGYLRDAIEQDYKEKLTGEEVVKSNKAVAHEIIGRISQKPADLKIDLLSKYLEVGSGIHYDYLDYSEPGFESKFLTMLGKWKVTLKE